MQVYSKVIQRYKYKYIDIEQYNTALNYNLNIIKEEKSLIASNLNYYIDATINNLKDKNIYNKHNLLKGLKIYLNLDLNIFNEINSIIDKYKKELNELETSIVILEPNTSNVLTIIGGKNYNESNLNRALVSNRQVGSLIKPLLYYLGLLNGYSPLTKFESKKTTFNIQDYGEYSPKNYNNNYPNRNITMIEAIGTSDNIYAIKLGLKLGSENFKKAISFFTENEINALPSLFLGSNEMTLLELAKMYNAFASLGDYYSSNFYNKVTDFNNQDLITKGNSKHTYLLKKYVTVLNQLLLAPFDKNINKDNKPTMINYQTNVKYSAKSGSTNSDSYVIGYNPNYTIAVWCGSDEGKEISKTPTKKIFQDIANRLSKYKDEKWYEPSKNLISKKIDPITGITCENGSTYYLIRK